MTLLSKIQEARNLAVTQPAVDRHLAEAEAVAQRVPTPVTQYLLHDGPSGVNPTYWNSLLPVKWTRQGGDWIDANNVRFGSTAFSRFAVSHSTLAPVEVDVTTLVRRQALAGNKGFMIRAVSGSYYPITFSGRLGANPPVLIINGGEPIVARATDETSNRSSYGVDGRTEFKVSRDGVNIGLIQFTYPVNTDVNSAVLRITPIRSGQPTSGTTTFGIFEIDAPRVLIAGAGRQPEWGIAQAFDCDLGLDQHPDVFVVGDVSNPRRNPWGMWDIAEPGPLGWTVHDNPATQNRTKYLRGGFRGAPDNTSTQWDLSGGSLKMNVHGGIVHNPSSALGPDRTGRPENVVEECYFRYMLFLEEGWGGPTDEYKMPAISDQFGVIKYRGDGTHYWQPYVGNGGLRGSGKWALYNGTYQYLGNSIRGKGGRVPVDGNPYAGAVRKGLYIYTIPSSGAVISGFGFNWYGSDMIPIGQWVCVEQYHKINSVIGPLDSNGNGTPVADGKFKMWINGVPVGEINNLAIRANVYYGIEGPWFDWYHGGASPQNNPLRDMYWRIAHPVAARSYIGPPTNFEFFIPEA